MNDEYLISWMLARISVAHIIQNKINFHWILMDGYEEKAFNPYITWCDISFIKWHKFCNNTTNALDINLRDYSKMPLVLELKVNNKNIRPKHGSDHMKKKQISFTANFVIPNIHGLLAWKSIKRHWKHILSHPLPFHMCSFHFVSHLFLSTPLSLYGCIFRSHHVPFFFLSLSCTHTDPFKLALMIHKLLLLMLLLSTISS